MKKIVFIHGFGGGKYEYAPLIKYFSKKQVKCYGFCYKKKFGQTSLEFIAKQFDKFINKNKLNNFIIVGLSQGGIIASYWLEFLRGKNKCKKIITICTPFYGSLLAYLLNLKGIKQLRPKSIFLKKLRNKIKNSNVKYYSVWNPLDLMVFPGKNARLDNKAIKIWAVGHPFTFWTKKTKKFIEKILECSV